MTTYPEARKLVGEDKVKDAIKLLLEQELEDAVRRELLLYHSQVVRWEEKFRMGLLKEQEDYLLKRARFGVLTVINILENEAKGVELSPQQVLESLLAKTWGEIQRLIEAEQEHTLLQYLDQKHQKLLQFLLLVAQKEKKLLAQEASEQISLETFKAKDDKLKQDKERLLAVVAQLEQESAGLSALAERLDKSMGELEQWDHEKNHRLAGINLLEARIQVLEKKYRRWQWLAGMGLGAIVMNEYSNSTKELNSSTYGAEYEQLIYPKNSYYDDGSDRPSNLRTPSGQMNKPDVLEDLSPGDLDLDVDL